MNKYAYNYSYPAPTYRDEKSLTPFLWSGAATVAVLLLLVLLPTILRQTLPSNIQLPLVSQIIENQNEYEGSSISLNSTIGSLEGNRAFTVQSTNTETPLLVISKKPLEAVGGSGEEVLYKPLDYVKLSGTIRTLDIKQLEKELGIDLDDSRLQMWEGMPIVIADTIEKE